MLSEAVRASMWKLKLTLHFYLHTLTITVADEDSHDVDYNNWNDSRVQYHVLKG